jgi:isopentenyl phosphate kinase
MPTYLKLGGSLITDKNIPRSADRLTIERLAHEIAAAWQDNPFELILGHGSGSYGHVPARQYGTRQGVKTQAQWRGFVEVWRQARDLNEIVLNACYQAGLPVISFPPSTFIQSAGGAAERVFSETITAALKNGLIPVVHGDVIFDSMRGGTIFSTEDVFVALAKLFPPERILLCGQEVGVWADFPACTQLIDTITPAVFQKIKAGLHGSAGIDITGGMEEKVKLMLELTERFPQMSAAIFSGIPIDNLAHALKGEKVGTMIRRT